MASTLIRGTDRQTAGDHAPSRSQDALLCDMHLPLCGTFYPLGFTVEIITNDRTVLEAAHESFAHSCSCRDSTPLQVRIGVSEGGGPECPPEPTRREYNHLYSLTADTSNHALLDLKTCTSFIWLNKSALKSKLYFRHNFLEKVVYLLLGASVVTDIHAACVSKHGRGILLCGDSGAGKSTLSYACAKAGWTYTSDDTSYLINASDPPRVIGHSHRVRFRPASKDLFPELANCEITPRMEGKPSIEVPMSVLPPVLTATEANVHAIVYLHRHPFAAGSLSQLPPGTATKRLRKDLYSAGEIRAKHEQTLTVLSDIPTSDLHYYTLDQAILQLDLLVDRP
jgi:energy-coupling factor transporter ATP-binding protein EcfA2